MTSDRTAISDPGPAEMQLQPQPVTPKTASTSLNPNAHVFQSKSPASPTDSSSEYGETDGTALSPSVEGYVYMNGDEGGKAGTTVMVGYPPTPESPDPQTQPPPTQQPAGTTPTIEFTQVNGWVTESGGGSSYPPSEADEAVDGSMAPEIRMDPATMTTQDTLRAMLRHQLEYYFCRENLAVDTYLVSQMDADQYVPIATIAHFNQVKKLTSDISLVVEVLRESPNVQVDERGEKVRPLNKRCVLILREIPDTTPLQDVQNLFHGQSCPRFTSCEFAHNDSWYVTFETEEDAHRAYRYLREEVQTFLDKPIMARIKAKPLLHSTVPKNGFKASVAAPSYDPNMYSVQSQPGPTATATTVPGAPVVTQTRAPTGAAPGYSYSTAAPQSNPAPQVQYLSGQQGYPFFPPTTVMQWPPNPIQYFDPSTVRISLAFAANGYTPTGFKLQQTNNRHGFQSMRNTRSQRDRESKPAYRGTSSLDRSYERSHHHNHFERNSYSAGDSRGSHDRSQNLNSVQRSSPRAEPNYPSSHHSSHHQSHHHHHHHHHSGNSQPPRRSSHPPPSHNVSSSASISDNSGERQAPSVSGSGSHSQDSKLGNGATANSSRQSENSHPGSSRDPPPQSARQSKFRGRRRRDEDVPKSSRSNTSTTKDKPPAESPKFELEATSFPPLPGSTSNTTSNGVFENKMSDVVKGTAKPLTREMKPPVTMTTMATPKSTAATAPSTVTTTSAPPTVTSTASAPATVTSSTATVTSSSQALSTSTPTTTTQSTPQQPQPQSQSQSQPQTVAAPSTTVPVAPTKGKVTVNTTVASPTQTSSPKGSDVLPPTPPQSPQQVTKPSSQCVVTASETTIKASSDEGSVTTPSPTIEETSLPTTSTVTPTQGTTAASHVSSLALSQEPSVKLSYAQMAQRAKERAEKEAAQRQKDQEDQSSASKEQASIAASSAVASPAATAAARPQTLKESTTNRLPPRSAETNYRKDRDREEPRDFNGGRGGPLPYNARRAKENRDVRTGGRDFYPPRGPMANGERDNFRDNRDRLRERRRTDRDYYDSAPQQRITGTNRQ